MGTFFMAPSKVSNLRMTQIKMPIEKIMLLLHRALSFLKNTTLGKNLVSKAGMRNSAMTLTKMTSACFC